jgi:hypothetical protein
MTVVGIIVGALLALTEAGRMILAITILVMIAVIVVAVIVVAGSVIYQWLF